MQVQRLRDGQILFREGDPGDAWFVIYDGVADVYKNDEFLPSRHIASLTARACFGEMAILDHSPRSASVIARGEATVFRFPRKEFEHLLHEDNLAAYKLIHEMAKVLCVRARNTAQQLTEALADKAPERLARTSLDLVHGHSVTE
jgi:CRP-like cAMP-binding protein